MASARLAEGRRVGAQKYTCNECKRAFRSLFTLASDSTPPQLITGSALGRHASDGRWPWETASAVTLDVRDPSSRRSGGVM